MYHDRKTEEQVIGTLILNPEAYLSVQDLFSPDIFYYPETRAIALSLRSMLDDKADVDIITLTNELRKNETIDVAGGSVYLMTITEHITTSSMISTHIKIVYEMWLKRQLAIAGKKIKDLSSNSMDINEMIVQSSDAVKDILNNVISKENKDKEYYVKKTITEIENSLKGEKDGITTGLSTLDGLVFEYDELSIIAARPSVGKTALMLQFTLNMAKNNTPCGIISMEMTTPKLIKRIVANIGHVKHSCIKNGTLNDEDLEKVIKYIDNVNTLPIHFVENDGMTINDIEIKTTALVYNEGVKIIFIDYLQLIWPDKSLSRRTREEQVSNISRRLKMLAKRLHISIVCLAQLNRDIESRGHSKPRLSDLRESGSLEQDASVVLFAYVDVTLDPLDNDTVYRSLSVSKNRNGDTFDANLVFHKEYQSFTEEIENNDSDIEPVPF